MTLSEQIEPCDHRNLLRYEEMEQALEFVLPYIHPEGSAKGVDVRNS